jgi:hypothetical protein
MAASRMAEIKAASFYAKEFELQNHAAEKVA